MAKKKGWFQRAREATTYDEVTGSEHQSAGEDKIKRMARHFWDRTGTGPVSKLVYTGGPVRRFMRRRAVGTKVAHELEGERYQDLRANPYKVVKDMVKDGELPVHPRDRKKLKEAFAMIIAEQMLDERWDDGVAPGERHTHLAKLMRKHGANERKVYRSHEKIRQKARQRQSDAEDRMYQASGSYHGYKMNRGKQAKRGRDTTSSDEMMKKAEGGFVANWNQATGHRSLSIAAARESLKKNKNATRWYRKSKKLEKKFVPSD